MSTIETISINMPTCLRCLKNLVDKLVSELLEFTNSRMTRRLAHSLVLDLLLASPCMLPFYLLNSHVLRFYPHNPSFWELISFWLRRVTSNELSVGEHHDAPQLMSLSSADSSVTAVTHHPHCYHLAKALREIVRGTDTAARVRTVASATVLTRTGGQDWEAVRMQGAVSILDEEGRGEGAHIAEEAMVAAHSSLQSYWASLNERRNAVTNSHHRSIFSSLSASLRDRVRTESHLDSNLCSLDS